MSKTLIGIVARPVAAGWNGKAYRVSVSLMPVAAGSGLFDAQIEELPKYLHDFANNRRDRHTHAVNLILRTMAASGAARIGWAEGAGTPVKLDAKPRDDVFIAEIVGLWGRLVDDAAKGIEKEGSRAAVFEAMARVATDVAVSTPRYLKMKGGKEVPDLLPTGRTDAANALLLELAADAAAAVKKGLGVTSRAWSPPLPRKSEIDVAGLAPKEQIDKINRLIGDVFAAKVSAYESSLQEIYLNRYDLYQDFQNNIVSEKVSKDLDARSSLRPLPQADGEIFSATGRRDLLERVLGLHVLALREDDKGTDEPKTMLSREHVANLSREREEPDAKPENLKLNAKAEDVARTLLIGVRNQPSLARLFGLVVDFDIDGTDLAQIAGLGAEGESFLTLHMGSLPTLAKAQRRSGQRSFWPATQEEYDLTWLGQAKNVRATGLVSQIDGVVDLGQTMTAAGGKAYRRFDLVTLDPTLGLEHLIAGSLRPEDAPGSADSQSLGLVTRGLQLGDRWRAHGLASEIAAGRVNAAPGSSGILLDADLLTVGYRMDVAVRPADASAPEWRSLMEREISFTEPGARNRDRFLRWLGKVGITYENERRRHCDAAAVLPTTRRRLVRDGGATREVLHTEEILASWEGPPLGIPCQSDPVIIIPGSDLAITRTFDLPAESDENQYRAHGLRYGWAYSVGLRPVWLGGVGLTVSEAKVVYQENAGRPVTLPAAETPAFRRFLRTEPIAPPVALLPEVIARDQVTILARQSATRAILRTCRLHPGQEPEGRETHQTWRVLVPPRTSLDQCIRHGVFDTLPQTTEIPPGALLGVALAVPKNAADETAGGFPAIEMIEGTADDYTPTFADVDLAKRSTSGAAPLRQEVFRTLSTALTALERGRKGQYYVDPTVQDMVIAVRRAGSSAGEGYFDGDPLVVPVLGGAQAVHPVVLQLQRASNAQPRAKSPTQKDFWLGEPILRAVTGQGIGAPLKSVKVPAGSIRAQVVTLALRPGEEVEIDCWYIPSTAKLLSIFALPETLAAQAAGTAVAAGASPVPTAAYAAAVLQQLVALLGEDKSEIKAGGSDNADPVVLLPALAGAVVPTDAIRFAARRLLSHLKRRPLDHIAKVQTISVVHAVDKPPRAPGFTREGDDKHRAFALLRRPANFDSVKDKAAFLEEASKAKDLSALVEGRSFIKAGVVDGIVCGGTIEIDLETCRQVEILGEMIPPTRGPIDDIRLGRTNEQRLHGEWPFRVSPATEDPGATPGASPRLSKRSRYLFGFDVSPEGVVSPIKQTTTLLQIDGLAPDHMRVLNGAVSNFAGRERFDLLRLQSVLAAQSVPGAPVEIRGARLLGEPYADSLARRVKLTVRATSRFDQYFRQTRPTHSNPAQEDVFPDPDQPKAVTSTSDEQSAGGRVGGESREVWIAATIAPMKPRIHTVLPAFATIPMVPPVGVQGPKRWEVTRTCALRIFLERPWFSSGEGELLGLVLWPPRIAQFAGNTKLAEGMAAGNLPRTVMSSDAPIREPGKNDPPAATMNFVEFSDEDLGPGGKFTTRWGADPIRSPGQQMGPFMPNTAFADFPTGNAREVEPSGNLAGYVPEIIVPIVDPHSSDADAAITGDASIRAALLTYVPRFDVEAEKWFVDVNLNTHDHDSPFVRLGLVRYQPHAAPQLRCSAPVVAWGQAFPTRKVSVSAESVKRAGKVRWTLRVVVTGRTSPRLGLRESGSATSGMRICLLETALTNSGLASERLTMAIDTEKGDKEYTAVHWIDTNKLAAQAGANGLTAEAWNTSFTVDHLLSQSGKKYAVVIEELEIFESTKSGFDSMELTKISIPKVHAEYSLDFDFGLSPLAPQLATDDLQLGGPRFLARVDLDL